MLIDENDEFDASVDPYDQSMDGDYNDGIAVVPADEFDDGEDVDWDDCLNEVLDIQVGATLLNDENTDYDEIED